MVGAIEKTTLLVVASLLFVVVASTSELPRPQASRIKCEVLDEEPPSKQQVIKFGRNSSLSFDGFVRLISPNAEDKFVALENGYWETASWSNSLTELNVRFDCAYIKLHPSRLVDLNFEYSAGRSGNQASCGDIERIPLDSDGAYTSPDGTPTDFKCMKIYYGLESKLAMRYIKLVDRD